jgi:hypothetical protein
VCPIIIDISIVWKGGCQKIIGSKISWEKYHHSLRLALVRTYEDDKSGNSNKHMFSREVIKSSQLINPLVAAPV